MRSLTNDSLNGSSDRAGVTASATLVELLRRRAREDAGRVAYTFLADGEEEAGALTYGELDRQARRIGAWLQAAGARGERALMLYPPGLEYLSAFFGCLYAGVVAVPTYPPRRNRNMLRLQAILADARPGVVLMTAEILSKVEANFAQFAERAGLRCVATDTLVSGVGEAGEIGVSEDDWKEQAVEPDALAFLQYTSGSTGTPKGVMLTHANLLHKRRAPRRARAARRVARRNLLPRGGRLGLERRGFARTPHRRVAPPLRS